MDLHEKRQLDLAEHMARVNEHVARAKAHARPWRSIIALVLAVAAYTVAAIADQAFRDWTGPATTHQRSSPPRAIAAFFVFGAIAVLGLAAKSRDVLTPAVGSSHAAVVRYAILLVGGLALFVLGISLMKVPIGQLLVGGAVTTILLGIAGQQSLANIFAGLVLLLSRPFVVGDFIRVKSGALGGVTDGLVTEIGITYLRMDTEDGPVSCPIPRCWRLRSGRCPGRGVRLPRRRPARAPRPRPCPPSHRQTSHRRTRRQQRLSGATSHPEPSGPRQTCLASYLATTSAGMRPRSLTSIPVSLAQLRIAALCCRCAVVRRLVRPTRAEARRACSAYRPTTSSNFWLCLTHRSIS